MSRYYYVDPTSRVVTGGPYHDGQTKVVLPSDQRIERIRQAEPDWNLYLAIEDNTLCTPPDYYVYSRTTAFEGLIGSPDARVRETVSCTQIPIDDLLAIKQDEIASHDSVVRYNGIDSSLSANWWIIATEKARQEWGSVAASLGARLKRITVDSEGIEWYLTGPNAPYFGIYNSNNQNAKRYQLDETAYLASVDDMSVHDQDTGKATDAAMSQAETYHGANDWDSLAALDPADPQWGYPAYQPLQGTQVRRWQS